MAIIAISGKLGSGKDTIANIIQYFTDEYALKDGLRYDEWLKECNGIEEGYNKTASQWKIKRFADKVKDIVCLLINCTREELEDRDFKEYPLGEEWDLIVTTSSYGAKPTIRVPDKAQWAHDTHIKMTPRLLLQLVGTDCGRDIIHPNLWVNSLFNEYKPYHKGTAHDRKDFTELYTHVNCKHCKKSYSGWKRQYLCKECIEDESIQFYPNWIIPDMRFPNELKAVQEKDGLIIRVERNDWKPKAGETINIKVFSNYSIVTYTHTDEEGQYHGVGSDGYKYKSSIIKKYGEHPSETALDDTIFENVIVNDGSITDLINKVKELLIKNNII